MNILILGEDGELLAAALEKLSVAIKNNIEVFQDFDLAVNQIPELSELPVLASPRQPNQPYYKQFEKRNKRQNYRR